MTATPLYDLRPLRWRDAVVIARWRYEGAYAAYNIELISLLTSLLVAQALKPLDMLGYYAVFDTQKELVGLFTFARTGQTVEVGLGMRPDLTGKGRGLSFLQVGLDFARQHYHPKTFRLSVAAFNQRAIRVYERAGFTLTTRRSSALGHSKTPSLEMTRPAG